jgi:hypothetical protein
VRPSIGSRRGNRQERNIIINVLRTLALHIVAAIIAALVVQGLVGVPLERNVIPQAQLRPSSLSHSSLQTRHAGDAQLPAAVIAKVQRILDRAARRLIDAGVDDDAVSPTPRSDGRTLDDGTDDGTLLVHGEHVPVLARA